MNDRAAHDALCLYLFDTDVGQETMDDEGEIFILQMLLEEQRDERLLRPDPMQKNVKASSEKEIHSPSRSQEMHVTLLNEP